MTTDITHIEAMAKSYATARAKLQERLDALEVEITDARRRKLPGIRDALNECANQQSVLASALRTNAALFATPKPRTVVFHGYKLGFQKAKGKIKFNAKRTIELIKKFFPKRTGELLRVKEEVDRDAVKKLTAYELGRIGCELVAAAGDEVVIKPIADDLDKLIKRILEKSEDESGEEEAAA